MEAAGLPVLLAASLAQRSGAQSQGLGSLLPPCSCERAGARQQAHSSLLHAHVGETMELLPDISGAQGEFSDAKQAGEPIARAQARLTLCTDWGLLLDKARCALRGACRVLVWLNRDQAHSSSADSDFKSC